MKIHIERLGEHGEGVGKLDDGRIIFLPQCLPNENVTAEIILEKKNYVVGKKISIEKESAERVAPACDLFPDCGGCQMQHLSYEGQLKEKREQVRQALQHIGNLDLKNIEVFETLRAKNFWNYRNKMQFPVRLVKGKISMGCFALGTHQIIPTNSCKIQREENNLLLQAMNEALQKFHLMPYDEDKGTGLLRHVMGRVGHQGSLMLVLVTTDHEIKQAKPLIKFLRQKLPNLVSVYQNIQTYKNNVILGRESKLLWGKPAIYDFIEHLKFAISPTSFFQVNTEQATNLYKIAREFAQLTGNETVFDLYCGTGTMALFMAKKSAHVFGIEIVPSAIFDAKKNAIENKIRNATFFVGDVVKLLPKFSHEKIFPDVVIVDPPRAGCDERVLQSIVQFQPRRLVYVSCNPMTLARDAKFLQGKKYFLKKVQPVDMFPMTSHIESVALFER